MRPYRSRGRKKFSDTGLELTIRVILTPLFLIAALIMWLSGTGKKH